MATARKKVSKTPETTTTKPAPRAVAKKTGDSKGKVIEEKYRIELGSGRFIDFRVTIASAPKVGPGPRPRFDEMVLMRRIDEDRVLTIGAELARYPTAGIKVGSGGPPIGGN